MTGEALELRTVGGKLVTLLGALELGGFMRVLLLLLRLSSGLFAALVPLLGAVDRPLVLAAATVEAG